VSGTSLAGNVVNLTCPTPPGGITVTLTSSKPGIAAVPASITVPGNSTVSPPFAITTKYVTTATQVTITADYLGVDAIAVLTVTPDGAASVNLSASTVVGGAAPLTQNKVALLAPAPPSGAQVKLTSSNPSVAGVPASVGVAAGAANSAAFQVTTYAVSSNTSVTITATYNGIAATATLTVTPPPPAQLALSQTSLHGGNQLAEPRP